MLLGGGDLAADLLEGVGMLVFEREVLQFCLYGEEPQAVGQRSVDVERFAGDLILLVGRHRAQRAHIVQAVGHLYEHHAYILRHRKQQLAEILGLGRGLVAEDAARNLGEPLHELGDFLAEILLDILYGVVRILHHVVEQCGADRG